ncbi:L,D-transpeptidase [Nitratireductor basaltis]|uniref:ErfK/YbiS/YcfS/YnhG family protein n=1 Tax=Nitratireductor basaltis TaxID=472175 RepID=A0A084UEN2_9HYPH|nr:L,D-transpeptidase [Nitratireductor basaltis]KFB11418.1 ErfK/YbiS/YcfS/YnhG family protein [Nitratireductor basaltis]
MNLRSGLLATLLVAAAFLSGCANLPKQVFTSEYGAVRDAGYSLPRIPIEKVASKYHRQVVNYDTREKPGTIIVDTSEKFLYFVMPDGKAMRYGIGVGRAGFEWTGTARIAMKREWPTWTPPAAMIRREPKLKKWAGGMPPGTSNPLGARALYLYRGGSDTGYRLHGTPEWNSIGKAMSSGCIRLMNQDIIDLYERAEVGAKVIVKG